MNSITPQTADQKWVLQARERAYFEAGQQIEVWQTISRPLLESTAMAHLTERQSHQKNYRILTGVDEALSLNSCLTEVHP